MADVDDLKALLARWNVPVHERVAGNGDQLLYLGDYDGSEDPGGYGSVHLPKSPAEEGYANFYTRFRFSADGAFRSLGAFE